ncbi:YjgP/YjgQ family permease [Alistipes sp. Z76]|nr:YjgP/YjgQ family permease [Alistipes sp. Z76]NCE68583.1 YjgP/YjgQ family permease [Muribaculaceae bacterium M3]
MKERFEISFPGVKILDRYILAKFLGTYVFAIAMISVILVVFDYAEHVDDFTEMKAPLSAVFLDYYINFIPDFVNQFSGLFTFISVIFFTSKMAYQTEIIAMLSGGMSFRRLMWPYFLGALAIMLLSLSLNLWVIPQSQISCVEFKQKYFRKEQNQQYDRHIYRQIEPGTLVYVRGFNRANRAAYMVLERYDGTEIAESLEASDLSVDPATGRWKAQRYIVRRTDGAGEESFEQRRDLDTLINLDVRELGRVDRMAITMKIGELNRFIRQQRSKGSDSINILEVERHSRFAYPMATFILTLIGVSLSSRKVRGGTGLHIGIGIALCFSYIMFNRVFEEFAKSGSLPVWLAVWMPNMIFAVIAAYLYRKAPK